MLSRFLGRALPAPLVAPLRRWRHRRRCQALYARYRGDTMIPEDQFADNLWLCRELPLPPGCVVECGVWRGGMSAAMAEVLGAGRTYYLFDSFEGLPAADVTRDGRRAVARSTAADPTWRLSAAQEVAEATMRRSGVTSYHLVPGWFKDTLATFAAPPISVLRLDGDWYDSTRQCLEALYPAVQPGGLVIIDDYYAWEGCARAVHEYLSQQPGRQDRIQQTAAGVAFIQKRSVPI